MRAAKERPPELSPHRRMVFLQCRRGLAAYPMDHQARFSKDVSQPPQSTDEVGPAESALAVAQNTTVPHMAAKLAAQESPQESELERALFQYCGCLTHSSFPKTGASNESPQAAHQAQRQIHH